MNRTVNFLIKSLGIEQASVSHAERLVSAAGGFVAILCIIVCSQWALEGDIPALLVASMGASAVLLFAVPHGPLSQPWPVVGGHLLSAVIGVACARGIGNEMIAASAAVGVSIGAMYYLKCIHPPGGATALTAVVGGEAVHALGFQFVLTPVLLNVVIILVTAVAFNLMFNWRRYPNHLHRSLKSSGESREPRPGEISHGDFVYALSQIDSYIDVSEEDLLLIYDLATQRIHAGQIYPEDVVLGGAYSNGEYGEEWSIRQVVDESPSADPEKDLVIYKVVAGMGRRRSAVVTRREFARWAKYRMMRDEENWKRMPVDGDASRGE